MKIIISTVTMIFTLSYPPGLTLPDDAEMYVGFGDGDALPWADLPPDFAPGSSCPCDHTLMHEYARPGSYEVTLIIRNLATSETFTIQARTRPSLLLPVIRLKYSSNSRHFDVDTMSVIVLL